MIASSTIGTAQPSMASPTETDHQFIAWTCSAWDYAFDLKVKM